jgi:hypothetical protein
VLVEYAFLLLAVGIPACVGLLAGGKKMYDGYTKAKAGFLLTLP